MGADGPGMVTWAAALSAWKRETGWSDAQIAAEAGLHRTTVTTIRLGQHAPQWRTRRILIALLPEMRAWLGRHAPALLRAYPSSYRRRRHLRDGAHSVILLP